MAYLKLGRNIRRFILTLILLTVVVHMVIIVQIKAKGRTEKKDKVIRDHEEALCNFRLNRSVVWKSQFEYECPEEGIVTVFYGGGLEAQMWAYSSVWAVARVTSLKPFVPICMHSFLSRVFDDLSVLPLSQISDCNISLPTAAASFPEWSGKHQSLVLPVFSCLSDTVLEFVDDIVREFRFKEHLVDRAVEMLHEFANGRTDDPFFVGVPIPSHWELISDGLNYPDEEYYARVFDFVRGRERNNTVFVIVSDGEISRAKFPGSDVFFVNTAGPHFGLNLALIALCNMSVLGFESTGLWGALLSKSEALLFDEFSSNFDSYVRTLPQFQIFE